MRGRWGFGLLVWAGVCTAQAPAQDEDERWIARYLDTAPTEVASSRVVEAGETVGFDALRQHLGRSVRVRLRDGRERRGLLERADAQTAQLSADVKGGRFSYSLRRDQVLRIQLEATP